MPDYRIRIDALYERFEIWNGYLPGKVRVIACGGTALTLLGFKDSTKDVDLMVPDQREYHTFTRTLQELGYKRVRGQSWQSDSDNLFILDIFQGNLIHTTELLESPLIAGNHTLVREYGRIYLGVLNDYDLITSKLLRGTSVDFDDCRALAEARHGGLDLKRLAERFKETALGCLGKDRLLKNLEVFLEEQGGLSDGA
jgi:hypothetical protein